MNVFKIVFCIALVLLIILSLVIYCFKQHSTINELKQENTRINIELENSIISNKIIQAEMDRVKEANDLHNNLTNQTQEKYKEMINDLKEVEKAYEDWFNAECPHDIGSLLTKDCGKVRDNSVRSTEPSSR